MKRTPRPSGLSLIRARMKWRVVLRNNLRGTCQSGLDCLIPILNQYIVVMTIFAGLPYAYLTGRYVRPEQEDLNIPQQ